MWGVGWYLFKTVWLKTDGRCTRAKLGDKQSMYRLTTKEAFWPISCDLLLLFVSHSGLLFIYYISKAVIFLNYGESILEIKDLFYLLIVVNLLRLGDIS